MTARTSREELGAFLDECMSATVMSHRLTSKVMAGEFVTTTEFDELSSTLIGIVGKYVRRDLPRRLSPDALQMLEDIDAALARDATA